MPEEEYKALLEKADGQIEKVVDKLRSEDRSPRTTALKSGKYWCFILLRATEGSFQTAAAIGKTFCKKKATSLVRTQPDDTAAVQRLAAILPGIFEAKPSTCSGL